MAQTHFKGSPVHTIGALPAIGSTIPHFELVTEALKTISLKDFHGKKLLLNIFPSIDTGICAIAAVEFHRHANELPNTQIICISMDLPFALKRFCEAKGLTNVIAASDFREHQFGKNYGVLLTDGPLQGFLARAVITTDEQHRVTYTELVPEIAQEPDYSAALAAFR